MTFPTTVAAPIRRFNIQTGLLTASGGDGQPMMIHGVASSNVRDHNGHHFRETAIRSMERQATGMTIFLNHKYQVPEDVFGVVAHARAVLAGQDIIDLHYDVEVDETNDRAVKAWASMKGRPGRATPRLGLSVGVDIPDGAWEVDKETGAISIDDVILHETSVVGIPANPRSWITKALEAFQKAEDAGPIPVAELEAAPPADESPCDTEGPEEGVLCTHVTAHEGRHSWDPQEEPDTSPDQPDANNQDPEPEADDSVPGQDEPAEDPPVQSGVALPDEEAVASTVASLENAAGKVDPTVLSSAVGLLRGMAETAVTLKAERDAALQAQAAAEKERDESAKRVSTVMAGIAEVVELIKATPLGRKTAVREAERRFSHLESVYGAEVISMIEGDTDGRG